MPYPPLPLMIMWVIWRRYKKALAGLSAVNNKTTGRQLRQITKLALKTKRNTNLQPNAPQFAE